jgi:hypothetical protein
MHPKRRINWILTSGLGNQLYGYFAGQYVAEKLNLQIQYIHNPLSKKHEQYNSDIRSFALNHPVRRAKTHAIFPEQLRRIFFGIKRRSNSVNKIYEFLTIKYSEKSFEMQSEISELENKLKKYPKRKISVEGYFQDFSYYVNLENTVIPEIKDPSDWYLRTKNRIRQINPIIVHLRLGDYIEQPNIWGILDTAYYEEALKRIRIDFPDNEIWIFSDNFGRAKKLLEKLKEFDLNYIESSSDQDPAEVLKIMSDGIAHVLSNSTFSLWAAMISEKSKLVVVPEPFFQNIVGQARNLPTEWVKMNAAWTSKAVIASLIQS